jgi:hypothetical protein
MTITTNKSPLRERADVPEGEFELIDDSVSDKRTEAEQMDDKEPTIDSIRLSDHTEYVVGAKKDSYKKDIHRNKLARHHGARVNVFTKKSA